jgi:hypothetical protein
MDGSESGRDGEAHHRSPGFLSGFVVSRNLVRLSLLKAAYLAVD